MSLISATHAAAASVRAISRAAGRAGASVAAAGAPTVTVTVGAGRDQSAEIYQRLATRLFDTVALNSIDRAAGAIRLAVNTNKNENTGFNTPDRMLSDVYALIFASRRGLKLPGYTTTGV